MIDFFCETLKPEVFWVAASALGTYLAAYGALVPLRNGWKRKEEIIMVVKVELDRNMQIIKKMRFTRSIKLPGPQEIEISAAQNNDALRGHINLEAWENFKYELTKYSPKDYQKYQDINRYAKALVEATMEPPALRLKVQIDAANEFVKKYDEYFGKGK